MWFRIMTSEKAGAHASCPHCACVKLKERSKRENRTTASGSGGSGSYNCATDSSLVIFGQTKLSTSAATVPLLLGLCTVFLVAFPKVYLGMMFRQLWGHGFARWEKIYKEKEGAEPTWHRSLGRDANTVMWWIRSQRAKYVIFIAYEKSKSERQQRNQISNIRFLNYVSKYAAKRRIKASGRKVQY